MHVRRFVSKRGQSYVLGLPDTFDPGHFGPEAVRSPKAYRRWEVGVMEFGL